MSAGLTRSEALKLFTLSPRAFNADLAMMESVVKLFGVLGLQSRQLAKVPKQYRD